MTHSVSFKNVTKKYKMYDNPKEKLKGLLFSDKVGEDFYALQNITFTADKGDVIGIIGVNGAGKSTISNLISGIAPETSGKIEINGEASLIAINAGLDSQLTGRENIELKCLMLGFSKKETIALMPSIIEFADIGKFIDQPVKNYSSGMKSRLGFAISVNIDPDILVIDEALSVGDQTFTNKCLDKMNEFKERGKTIFFISHSIGQVKKFCEKALWLEAGMIKAYGTIKEVVPEYEAFLKEYKAMPKEEKKKFQEMIVDKRSRLISQPTVEEAVPAENKYRIKKKRKTKWKKAMVYFISSFIIIIGALFSYEYILKDLFFNQQSKPVASLQSDDEDSAEVSETKGQLIETEKGEDEDDVMEEPAPDYRYINVERAYIRSGPSTGSEAVAVAGFGGVYEIMETKIDEVNDMEWLHIERKDLGPEGGWISSKLLSTVSEEVADVDKISILGEKLSIPMDESLEIIGKREQSVNSPVWGLEYQVFDDVVTGFTNTVNTSSKDKIIELFGEPQLEMKYLLFYHGEKYNYIFHLRKDDVIEKVTINDVKATFSK